MSDDFDDLFDAPVTPRAAAPATTPATAPATSTAVTPAKPLVKATLTESMSVWMPIFRPGAQVHYQSKPYTVSHVLISKGDLFVYLKEIEGVVPAEKVRVELTHFTLNLPLKLAHTPEK